MKSIISIAILAITLSGYGQVYITPADLNVAIGSWEGSLTYIDYKTNKPFSMPARLFVKKGKDGRSLDLNTMYPDEPQANNSGKMKISKDGTLLNKHEVISKERFIDGNIQIQTEHIGKDDRRKALIRNTYVFGKASLLFRKEVQFEESEGWIKRSEFSYTRKK